MVVRALANLIALGLLAVPAVAQEPELPGFPTMPMSATPAEKVPPRFGLVTEITEEDEIKLQTIEFVSQYRTVQAKVDAEGLIGEMTVMIETQTPVVREITSKLDEVRVENFRGNRYQADELPELFTRPRWVVFSREDEPVDSQSLLLLNEDAIHLILPPDRGRIASLAGAPVMFSTDSFATPTPPPAPPDAEDHP